MTLQRHQQMLQAAPHHAVIRARPLSMPSTNSSRVVISASATILMTPSPPPPSSARSGVAVVFSPRGERVAHETDDAGQPDARGMAQSRVEPEPVVEVIAGWQLEVARGAVGLDQRAAC